MGHTLAVASPAGYVRCLLEKVSLWVYPVALSIPGHARWEGQPHGVSDSRFSYLETLIGYCDWTWHELRAADLRIRTMMQVTSVIGSGQTGVWLGTEPLASLRTGRCASSNQCPLKGPMPSARRQGQSLKSN